MKKYAIITMDVEDWYHTYFPEANVDRSISLLDGLDVALDIMKKDDIHGSFFVVGEIADKLADKLREMDKEGHDIAVHNCQHLRPVTMTPDEFRIPTWMNAIARSRAKTNIEMVSEQTKAQLAVILRRLEEQITQTLEVIEK